MLAIAALVLAALAVLQVASGAIFSHAGASTSVPAHAPVRAGVAVYRAIERVWGPPFVEAMLARAVTTSP